jgi:glycosyltransferase involved in cell wall biosynthesis
MTKPDLTIIVPALNEERTIREVVDRLLSLNASTQIIVVNDGSRDKTADILREFANRIEVVTNAQPSGKGAAIVRALPLAKGKLVAIQDADLEYAPEELVALAQPILDEQTKVVFGNRFHHGLPKDMALPNKIVNILLAATVRVLFGVKLHDEATCYKLVDTELLRQMNLQCKRFEFCPEVTAKAIRLGAEITELPISYVPRTKADGKKIRWTDAPDAFLTLFKYRFWKP